jgi:hypothetical protein
MATATVRRTRSKTDPFAELKRRVAALGMELFADGDRQVVLAKRRLPDGEVEFVAEFIHRNDSDDDLGEWLTLNGNKRAGYNLDDDAPDRQLKFRQAIEAVAAAVTVAEQANADLERDKTPIDDVGESNLKAAATRLYNLLEDGRYVGVDYGDESKSKGVANLLGQSARAAAAKGELKRRARAGGAA